MRWHLEGLDAENGRERVLDVEASCEDRALEFASESRLLVERCVLVADLTAPRPRAMRFKIFAALVGAFILGIILIPLRTSTTRHGDAESGSAPLDNAGAAPATVNPSNEWRRRPTLGLGYDELKILDNDMFFKSDVASDGTPKFMGISTNGLRGMLIEGSPDDVQYVHYYVQLPSGWLERERYERDDGAPITAAAQMIYIGDFVTRPDNAGGWIIDSMRNGVGTYQKSSGHRILTLQIGSTFCKIALSAR